MSRSWIERAGRRLTSSARAGLALGRDYVGFAEIVPADGGWRIAALAEAKLDSPLFARTPDARSGAALRKGLGEFAGRLKGRYLPLHVSLPDAAVRCATFELDELPKSRSAQIDLVRFRFGRQGGDANPACACQSLAGEGDKHLLFGMAADPAWQGLLTAALADTGIYAWSLSANACRTFNRFHDRLARSSGALVALAPDAWSLWLWDEHGRPRFARGRWRTGTADGAEIALEVERSILAYVHGGRERSVLQVYVAGGAQAGALADALDARLREACVRLPPGEGGIGDVEAVASAPLSLAAALER